MFVYVLKGTVAIGVIAVTELVARGELAGALLSVPMVVTAALVTRRFARRRAREGARS